MVPAAILSRGGLKGPALQQWSNTQAFVLLPWSDHLAAKNLAPASILRCSARHPFWATNGTPRDSHCNHYNPFLTRHAPTTAMARASQPP